MQATSQTTPPDPKIDRMALRAELERMLEEGARDSLLDLVLNVVEQLAAENNKLAWRLHAALRQLYKKKSEKISPNQLALFLSQLTSEQSKLAEVELPPDKKPSDEEKLIERRSSPKAPHKKPFPDHLRREIRNIPVPEEKTVCQECGEVKKPMGFETRTIWEFKPAEFFIIEEHLEKRACKACQSGVTTAEGSPKPIEGGRPGPGLLSQIVTSKARDACPLYRQAQIYKRSGIELSSSTLGDWFAFAADMLEPIWKYARHATLSTTYLISLDDTGMPVLDRENANGIKRGHIWTYLGDQNRIAFCDYTPTWEGAGPRRVLDEFQGTVVQSDGYAGIDAFFERPFAPLRAGCMDHLRRKWVAAMQAGDARAAVVVSLIGKLYAVEATARTDGVDPPELLRRRQEQSKPIVDRLLRIIVDLHAVALPKSPLGKATTYAINQWETLVVFLDDPRVPLANAHVERHQRRTALVRKNSLFAGSDDGARRLAIIQTIVVLCELHNVSMFEYLRDVLANIASGWPQSRIDELLPDTWAANQKREQADTERVVAAGA